MCCVVPQLSGLPVPSPGGFVTAVLKRMAGLAAVVAVCWVVWLAFLLSMQDRMLYPGAMGIQAPAPFEAPEGTRVLHHAIAQGEVHAWLLPPLGHGDDPPGLVVHLHGNGERIELWAQGMRPWREAGYWLLLPEYRGYGGAAGSPTEAGIVQDAVAFLRVALDETQVPAERVLLHGRSLGAGVAAQVATHIRPAGIVLESGFTRVVDLTRRMLVPDFLVRDRYDTLGALRGTNIPVLILHGLDDEVIPFSHAERLHGAIPGSELVPMRCGHNDCPDDLAAYWERLRAFAAVATTSTGER